MKLSYGVSILIGMLISVVVSVSAIYMVMKSGMSIVLDTAVFSIALLSIFRKLDVKNVAISDIFARGAVAVANLSAAYFAVIFILGENKSDNTLKLFLVITFSAVFGVLFFSAMQKNRTIDGDFPMLKPRIALIAALETTKSEKYKISLSMICGGIFSFLKSGLSLLPSSFSILGNEMFAVNNSLILVGTGCFIGYKIYLKLAIGGMYSFVVWQLFQETEFQSHLMNPYIFSVTFGFALAMGLATIGKMVYQYVEKHFQNRNRTRSKEKDMDYRSILVLFFYMMFGMVFYYFCTDVPIWSFLPAILLSVMLSISTIRVIAETGFWVSNLEEVIPLFLVGITFFHNGTQITLLLTGMVAFEAAGIYYVLNQRVGDEFGIRQKTVIRFSVFAALLGSGLCIMIVDALAKSIGFATAELPAPTSRVFAMTVQGLVQSLDIGDLPSYLSPAVVLVAFAICFVLITLDFSPMTIVAGMVLPFGVMITVGVGAFINFVLKENEKKYRNIISGASIGEGLITAITIMLGALL